MKASVEWPSGACRVTVHTAAPDRNHISRNAKKPAFPGGKTAHLCGAPTLEAAEATRMGAHQALNMKTPAEAYALAA